MACSSHAYTWWECPVQKDCTLRLVLLMYNITEVESYTQLQKKAYIFFSDEYSKCKSCKTHQWTVPHTLCWVFPYPDFEYILLRNQCKYSLLELSVLLSQKSFWWFILKMAPLLFGHIHLFCKVITLLCKGFKTHLSQLSWSCTSYDHVDIVYNLVFCCTESFIPTWMQIERVMFI